VSDFRAIGGVSATLQTLLRDRMELPDGMATVPVTVGPPPFSTQDVNPRLEPPRLNLFLYRVTENGFLQNQEIPGRSASSGYGHPPLSLNLHYLVSAYGNQEIVANGATLYDDTDAHFVLGSAMRVLHDVPIVTNSVTTLRVPSGVTVLHESLREAFEQLRLSLEPLTLEDITKIWTALALRYRLSAAYLVNVVQIESRRPRTFPRPVGKPVSATVPPLPADPPSPGPWVYGLTIQAPTISELRVRRSGQSQDQPFPYAAIGDTVVLLGTSLSGPQTSVAIGGLEVPASLATDNRVEAVIPDTSIAGSGPIPPELQLQPGVRSVRVVAHDPMTPQSTISSNEAALMLVPSVALPIGYTAGPPRTLTINGSRMMPAKPGGETIIGRAVVPDSAYLAGSTQATLVVPIPPQLPMRGVKVFHTGALADPFLPGAGPHTLSIKIGATTVTRTRALPASLPLADLAGIVEGMIHDAAPAGPPPDARFTDARVTVAGNRLFVIPGDLTSSPVTVTSPTGTFSAALALGAAQLGGAGSAFISGVLTSPPPLSSITPRVRLKVGAVLAIDLDVPAALSLDELAVGLQSAINAFGGAAYANAVVATSRSQLLLVPSAAGAVSFDGVLGVDDRTVVELQLHARFAVRVRVNGAESIDSADVELPQ
jgi:hypothetical protein